MEKQLEVLIIMLGISTVVQLLIAFSNRYNKHIEEEITKIRHDVYDHDGDVRSGRHRLANELTIVALKVASMEKSLVAIEKAMNGMLTQK